jgi:putative transcriptional regulator
MSSDFAPINLTHHFLIAMPSLQDEGFAKSVVYLCEHNESGALGLVINKPSELNLKGLFDKVDLSLQREDLSSAPVFQGGPLLTERGFVLHEPLVSIKPEKQLEQLLDTVDCATNDIDVPYASTMSIPGGLEMTTSRDVLEAIAAGAGPRRVLVSLGYSSWGKGQLESELADNSWLTVEANADVIFDTPIDKRYDSALKLLGVEPWALSPIAGRA